MRKLFSLIAAVLFAGSMMAADATMTAGTNGSACTVNDVAGIKCGTSSKAGDMTITVGAGATKLSFYAAAWNGVSDLSLNLAADGVTISPASVSLTADAGISSNTPFTLSGLPEDFKFEVELTGVTAETAIAVTSSAAKRFVVWGAAYETGEVPPTPAVATPVISGEAEFTDSVIVTITCSTPETDIYYTTDGTTDPKCDCAAAPEYTHEIVLKETTTIMAAAYTGNDWSAVATKTFTKVVPPVNLGEKTIAEFLALKNVKDTCILTGVVDSIKNTQYGNLYLSDATGQVYVYGVLNAAGESKKFADLNVEAGDTLTIKAIYSEFNNAPQVKNAIFVSVKKAQGDTPVAEWTEIVFNEAVAAADLPADASFEFEGLHVAITDSENKMAIDANNAYFGTADEYTKYAFRLKTGGKSLNGSKQNFITINVPEDGLLRLAVRSGSGTDSTRTLVLAQGNDTLYNAIVKDADAIEVAVNDSTKIKVFPYVTVPVKAGNVDVAYPENSLNFYSFAFQLSVVPPTPVVAQYEVAEAIAAGLKDDDELFVRGIITKLEFKGKNFAKYGSVNIYVKDATGAEGEFEFYNCYSLNADTFRTSVPNYDPQSSDWTQLREVADENGNAIHVGDTVIAFGKYKLFNSTHELNTGCYLTEIKHAPVVPADTIALDFNVQNTTYAFVDNQYFDEYGTTDIYLSDINVNASTYEFEGDGNYLVLDFYPEDANNVTGIYKSEDETLDLEYTYMLTINGTDTAEVMFADAGIMVSIGQTDKERGVAELAIVGNLISTEGDIYLLSAAIIAYYDFLPEEQGVEDVVLDLKAIKKIINGQVIIEKNGVKYNVLGNTVK